MTRFSSLRLPATALVLLASAVAVYALRASYIIVQSGSDCTLTAVPDSGTVTLRTGPVTSFHLTGLGDATGRHVSNVASGTTLGDALVYGQAAASGDITGTYPTLNLVNPLIRTSIFEPPVIALAGMCTERTLAVPGVKVGMVPSITVEDGADPGTVTAARVEQADQVVWRVCAPAYTVVGTAKQLDILAVP